MLNFNGLNAYGPAPATYRYLRLTVTADIAGGSDSIIRELDYSADGGSTWLPASAMTTNSAPSPLVASADSEFSGTFAAWKGFDNDTAGVGWASTVSSFPHYLQIDLGSGNGIAPNRMRYYPYNTGGTDHTLKNFTVKGSNTGSFAGEEVTLLTVTNETTKTDAVAVTYSF